MHDHRHDTSRREFLRRSTAAGAGVLLSGSTNVLGASTAAPSPRANVPSRGYAARDTTGVLSRWSFNRRAVGDDDVLIDIKYCGICHSDIHQLRGEWGTQQYPQVPGHEITGIVAAVGRNVTRFKVGDQAGVGTMLDSCLACDSCRRGEEQYCDNDATLFAYGAPDRREPTGITQGGYATNVVVKEHFAINIPTTIRLQDAAPLLCAGVTTYFPLVRNEIRTGHKVGVAGIGGLGHLAVKLARARGAEVYAFTTSPSKVEDIRRFGAQEVIVVDTLDKLRGPHAGTLDYMISTIPVDYDIGAYAALVKPYGTYTQVGMPAAGRITMNTFAFNDSRAKVDTSLVGGIPLTQQLVDYCAEFRIAPEVQVIRASDANDAWGRVLAKEARYRYVIDTTTI